jgi:hypothetical protein
MLVSRISGLVIATVAIVAISCKFSSSGNVASVRTPPPVTVRKRRAPYRFYGPQHIVLPDGCC